MRMFNVVKCVDIIVVTHVLKNVVKVLYHRKCKCTFLLCLHVKQKVISPSFLPEGNCICLERLKGGDRNATVVNDGGLLLPERLMCRAYGATEEYEVVINMNVSKYSMGLVELRRSTFLAFFTY